MREALRLNLILTVIELVLIVVIVLALPSQLWLVGVVIIVGIGINYLILIRGVRRQRAALERLTASHSGSLVRPTSFTGDVGLSRADGGRVIAVVADRAGLSFRDTDDAEVLRIPPDSILSLEVGPLARRIRPAVVTRIDGPPVSFFAGTGEGQLVDNIVALRTALGRPVG